MHKAECVIVGCRNTKDFNSPPIEPYVCDSCKFVYEEERDVEDE